MASTYSDLKIELIGTGDQSGTWGNTTNTNLGTAIEQAITGSGDVTFASADITLTLTDTNASQTARNLRLNLGGTSGGARNLIVPSIEKQYIIYNGTADTVTVKNASGTGVAVPTGKTMVVFNNATNVVDVTTHASSLTLGTALAVSSGGTGQSSALVAGGVIYGASTTAAGVTSAGTSGQPLLSGGASAPSFGTLGVAGGGTGITTTTAYGILAGGTTSTGAFQNTGAGTAGQVLTSNGAGALPTFQAAAGFPVGTVMLFAQTSAPTGWTKDTTNYNNSGLRVVTGTASTGGSVDFTTAFASQTPTGSVSITSVTGTAGSTTLTTPQIPSHSHTVTVASGNQPSTAVIQAGFGSSNFAYQLPGSIGNTGGSGSHDHPFSFSSGSGSFSGNAINLAVKYVDVIRATKD